MKHLLKKAAIAAAVLFFTACSAAEAAGTVPALGVSSAAGKAGETVEVVVYIQGITALEGVEGFSGGEFVLEYNPALAEVNKAEAGEAISGFMFIRNLRLTENSIKVVWASGSNLTSKDGNICKVTFTMKKDGTLQPTLKNLLLFDQDVRSLQITALDPAPESGETSPDDDQKDNGKEGEGPAGSGNETEGESASRYGLSPAGKADPGSSSPAPGEEGSIPGETDTPGETGTGKDPGTPGGAGNESAAPETPGENKPERNTALWYAACSAVLILGLAGYLGIRRIRHKHQS
jgi:hypothetical protein